MKRALLILCVLTFSVVTILSAEAGKLTKEDVAAFSKQGKTEDEIVSLLTESGSEFSLTDADRRWLREQGVAPWVCIVMDMKPQERREKVPIYEGGKITKQGVVNLTKKGYPAHEICLMIASTQSKYTLTSEEKDWLRSEGVDPLVISLMETQQEKVEEKPFLERGEIERGGTPICGGKYYEDAVDIKPGKYRLDHQLRPSEYDYFKMRLKNGQKLTCSIRTTDVAHSGGVQIHSKERTILDDIAVYGPNESNSCFYALYNSPEKEQDVYIVIGLGCAVEAGIIYDIGIEDYYDANSATDAGNSYDTAMPIKPGKYPNNWAPLNDADMYTMQLKKNAEIAVKVIPETTEDQFRLTVLNEDRETIVSEWNKQPGAVVKVSAKNANADQKFYIQVDRGSSSDAVGKYILEIEVK